MSTNHYSIFGKMSILVVCLLLAIVAHNAICHQVPSSEPYASHFDPYSYGYETEDNYGNKQWRQERSSHPHEVHGSYGYKDKNGVYREVTYTADHNGFRANIKTNEPGVADKDPASTKIDSHYSPPAAPPAAPSHQHYAPASPSSHQHQHTAASPPVYTRQHYGSSYGYQRRA